MSPLLKRLTREEVRARTGSAFDERTHKEALAIVGNVRANGGDAVREYAERFGERKSHDPLVLRRDAMAAALAAMDPDDRGVLERANERIVRFAAAQREAIADLEIEIPGGRAGHTLEPVRSAGCYAPNGRYPLPSSVLMTAATARAAGCERVVVASPGAAQVTLAAASIAGADEFLAVGGAHAIGAMAYGFEGFERCDVIAGPGNRWVTAAKHIVSVDAGIDMLAGPSELLVLADRDADPSIVAADLLAQAEHDDDAIPMLVTTCEALIDNVEIELAAQLAELPTRDTADRALRNGFVTLAGSTDEMIELADSIAPEHLEILTRDADNVASRIRNAGALFIGALSAEVMGDYGAGPNHTLPTGGTARFQAGLSVMHFLRLRTWLRMEQPPKALIEDTRRLAVMEGLAGHTASAIARRT